MKRNNDFFLEHLRDEVGAKHSLSSEELDAITDIAKHFDLSDLRKALRHLRNAKDLTALKHVIKNTVNNARDKADNGDCPLALPLSQKEFGE